MIRREAEQCDRVEDFLVYSSSYGGTGSGLTQKILDQVNLMQPKFKPVSLTVAPSPESSYGQDIVSCYNHILAFADDVGFANGITVFVDNE